MNKARIKQEYTVSGNIMGDLAWSAVLGLNLFFCLVLFLSF